MATKYIILLVIALLAGGGAYWWISNLNQYELPEGTSEPFVEDLNDLDDEVEETLDALSGENRESTEPSAQPSTNEPQATENGIEETGVFMSKSSREILITDGTKHSIPIEEILNGGPPKDGIPSIDEPKFVTAAAASLIDSDIGLGLFHNGEARFYSFDILVRHELVNDVIGDQPILVSYCPLCLTGVVYDRTINGEPTEFGVSGLLWQSNLLMYNRTGDPETESLWSQVLGEAVLGEDTGTKIRIIPSDIVQFGEWKKLHPETVALSRDTGIYNRNTYDRDPYGDYYTDNNAVSFGAVFTDHRLQAKDLVLGIEIDGQFKAYHDDAIAVGEMTDTFAGKTITIRKNDNGEVKMFIGEQLLPFIPGFWFSWVAVHPETELFK